ncbi:M17 family metallopeptidase [Bacteroidota bacterium]
MLQKKMQYSLHISAKINDKLPLLVILQREEGDDLLLSNPVILTKEEHDFFQNNMLKKIHLFSLPRLGRNIFFQIIDKKEEVGKQLDEYRTEGVKFIRSVSKYKYSEIQVWSYHADFQLAFAEGFLLTSYVFDKYKSEKEDNDRRKLTLISKDIGIEQIMSLTALVEGVFLARDLVNEPGSELTAEELAKRIDIAGGKAGFNTEIFNKAKIETLKMGGLLAVNRGSMDSPTFSILKWKPENAVNKDPLILVGKGVVFDTGGLSLKPTANSMDHMKCDMSGAAAVAGSIYACAKIKLPVYVLGLIPATDNRPGQNAYYPGDVVKMYDGSTVEVLNTDAEGRMILADALAYAKKYNPQLVIDVATLTGAAAMAIGKYGIPCFTNSDKDLDQLKQSGQEVYERLVNLPMWEEYAELIKSDIADVKNIGGKEAGAITAAKFLERFTDYPWIHLDIAGSAFSQKEYKYYTKGASGIAVRLLFHYLIQKAKNE